MLLQILNGTIDPAYVLNGVIVIISVFVLRYLNKLEKRAEKSEIRHDITTRVLLQMLTKLGDNDDDFYADLRNQLNQKE